jgi:hypothetical protein
MSVTLVLFTSRLRPAICLLISSEQLISLEWIAFWLRIYFSSLNDFIYAVANHFQQHCTRRSVEENLLLSCRFVTPMYHFTFLKRYITIELSTAHCRRKIYRRIFGLCGTEWLKACLAPQLLWVKILVDRRHLFLSKGFENTLIKLYWQIFWKLIIIIKWVKQAVQSIEV